MASRATIEWNYEIIRTLMEYCIYEKRGGVNNENKLGLNQNFIAKEWQQIKNISVSK